MGCDVSAVQRITVLGATGSIGLSTLDVIARHPERYSVFALSGYSRIDELLALCVRHRPEFAVVPSAEGAARLRDGLAAAGCATQVLEGEAALCQVAQALIALVLVIGSSTHSVTRELIFVLAFLLGSARSFEMPATQALLPNVVPAGLFPRAVAASASAMRPSMAAARASRVNRSTNAGSWARCSAITLTATVRCSRRSVAA